MKVTVARPSELGRAEISRWQQLQGTDLHWQNPFLSAEFAVAASNARPTARVAVLEDGSAVQGFFAFDIDRFGIGRPVAPGLCDSQAVIASPDLEWSANELLAGCGLAVWEFDHLVGSQTQFARFESKRPPSPIIELAPGYEAYEVSARARSSKFFKTIAYKRRKTEREVGAVDFVFGSFEKTAFNTLMQWKSEQYRRTGRADRFANKWVRQMMEELVALDTDSCAGVLSTLSINGELAAVDFSLRSRTVLACWFPSHDNALGKYSPGVVRTMEMIRSASEAKLEYMDLGKGEEEYKHTLKNAELVVAEGLATRDVAAARVYAAARAPKQMALEYVLARPKLRSFARRTLAKYGELRSRPGFWSGM